jgi:hypothetical protein
VFDCAEIAVKVPVLRLSSLMTLCVTDVCRVLVQHPLASVTMAPRTPQAASWRPGAKELSVSYAVDVGEKHFNPSAKNSTTGISKIEHVSTALPCQTSLAVGAIIGEKPPNMDCVVHSY